MADRYLDDSEADNLDSAQDRGGPPIRRRRRIRVTQDGMPDQSVPSPAWRKHSREEHQVYGTSDRLVDSSDDTSGSGGRVERPIQPFASRQQPMSGATVGDAFARSQATTSRRRMPQLPIHGGLNDLIGRGRLAMALLMGLLAFVGYNVSRRNTFAIVPTKPTESRPISLVAEHDIALGQKSTRQVLSRYGGITRDEDKRNIVKQIGTRLVRRSEASRSRYEFTFDVLAEESIVGAFALPGGRIYLTAALLDQLNSRGEVAGILAHEMAHVTQRHGVVRLANASLASGTTGAVVMASFLDPETYKPTDQDVTHLIAETLQLRYDPSEVQTSDQWAVHYMTQAGFHPESFVSALRKISLIDGQPTSFALRHQPPANQLALIQQRIRSQFPQGIPADFIR